MRLLICAGGTGGGVYPALAVVEQLMIAGLNVSSTHPQPSDLQSPRPSTTSTLRATQGGSYAPSNDSTSVRDGRESLELLWVGGESGMEEELVKHTGIPFQTIPAAGLHGIGPRALPRNLITLVHGVRASVKILSGFKPDVLFFTGGYVAGPMAFAGRKVPTLLYVPDIEPGLALKSLARFADVIAVTALDSQIYFSRKVITTGYPIRAELTAWNKQKACAELNLDGESPVLLVFGGSKGAHSINEALVPNLPDLLELTQIVHISGSLDWEFVQAASASLTSEQRARYHIFPYLHEEMGAALASADLVISRAGASTLGEFPYFGLPAILVPYPHAWRYQKVNADYLAERGAAVVVKDEMLKRDLLSMIRDLLTNPSKRKAMSQAMKRLSHPEAAQAIAGQIMLLGGQHL